MPIGHFSQVSFEVAATEEEKVPAPHDWQYDELVAAIVVEKVPCGQDLHNVCPFVYYFSGTTYRFVLIVSLCTRLAR